MNIHEWCLVDEYWMGYLPAMGYLGEFSGGMLHYVTLCYIMLHYTYDWWALFPGFQIQISLNESPISWLKPSTR